VLPWGGFKGVWAYECKRAVVEAVVETGPQAIWLSVICLSGGQSCSCYIYDKSDG